MYAQKGELITDLEVTQARLNNVNQRIAELKNAEMKQNPIEKKDIDKPKK